MVTAFSRRFRYLRHKYGTPGATCAGSGPTVLRYVFKTYDDAAQFTYDVKQRQGLAERALIAGLKPKPGESSDVETHVTVDQFMDEDRDKIEKLAAARGGKVGDKAFALSGTVPFDLNGKIYDLPIGQFLASGRLACSKKYGGKPMAWNMMTTPKPVGNNSFKAEFAANKPAIECDVTFPIPTSGGIGPSPKTAEVGPSRPAPWADLSLSGTSTPAGKLTCDFPDAESARGFMSKAASIKGAKVSCSGNRVSVSYPTERARSVIAAAHGAHASMRKAAGGVEAAQTLYEDRSKAVGRRVKMVKPYGGHKKTIPVGTEGVVTSGGFDSVAVKFDNGARIQVGRDEIAFAFVDKASVKASVKAGLGGNFKNLGDWQREVKRRQLKSMEITHPSGVGTHWVAKDMDGNRVGEFDPDNNVGTLTQDPTRPVKAAFKIPRMNPDYVSGFHDGFNLKPAKPGTSVDYKEGYADGTKKNGGKTPVKASSGDTKKSQTYQEGWRDAMTSAKRRRPVGKDAQYDKGYSDGVKRRDETAGKD